MQKIDLTKRHVIESVNEPFIIEFTDEQDVYDTEQYGGLNAYECYILDDEKEPMTRAVYYCGIYTVKHFLIYYENIIFLV